MISPNWSGSLPSTIRICLDMISKRSWMSSFTPFEMGLLEATGLSCVASEHSRCASMRHGWVATRAPKIRFLFQKKSFPPSRLPRRCISVSILYRAGLGTERDRTLLTLPIRRRERLCCFHRRTSEPEPDGHGIVQSAARTSFSSPTAPARSIAGEYSEDR